jgi:hypothetical protein
VAAGRVGLAGLAGRVDLAGRVGLAGLVGRSSAAECPPMRAVVSRRRAVTAW